MTTNDTLWKKFIQAIRFTSALLAVTVIAIAFSSACNGKETAVPISEIDSALASRAYPITDVSAGPFHIGAVIQHTMDGFEVDKSIEIKSLPGGMTIELTVYIYYIGNEGWVKITPQYDSVTGQVSNRIGEIYVYSDLFLTYKHIGAISSLGEFAKVYPDTNILCADEDNMYAVMTPQLPNVQFLLSGEHYIGDGHDRDSSTRGKLNVSDFKNNAHFHAILIRQQ